MAGERINRSIYVRHRDSREKSRFNVLAEARARNGQTDGRVGLYFNYQFFSERAPTLEAENRGPNARGTQHTNVRSSCAATRQIQLVLWWRDKTNTLRPRPQSSVVRPQAQQQ